MSDRTCTIDGCTRPPRARGWCNAHYAKWQRHGDPLKGRRIYASPQETLAERTVRQGDCLIWTGSCDPAGYGHLRFDHKNLLAHRVAWELKHGPIPEGAQVDHTCWNRACVDVDHLRLTTQSQNQSNRSGPQANSSTGVRNVTLTDRGYMVQIKLNRKLHHRGTFATLEEARKAAERGREEMFGEYAGQG